MSKNIFLSYAGRTVKTAFDGSSTDELASCFSSQFPHSTAKFVFYVTDPATGIQYEVADIADVATRQVRARRAPVPSRLPSAPGATSGTSDSR